MRKHKITKKYLKKVWKRMQRNKQKKATTADANYFEPFFVDEGYRLAKPQRNLEEIFG